MEYYSLLGILSAKVALISRFRFWSLDLLLHRERHLINSLIDLFRDIFCRFLNFGILRYFIQLIKISLDYHTLVVQGSMALKKFVFAGALVLFICRIKLGALDNPWVVVGVFVITNLSVRLDIIVLIKRLLRALNIRGFCSSVGSEVGCCSFRSVLNILFLIFLINGSIKRGNVLDIARVLFFKGRKLRFVFSLIIFEIDFHCSLELLVRNLAPILHCISRWIPILRLLILGEPGWSLPRCFVLIDDALCGKAIF